jgi:hypothetical protein
MDSSNTAALFGLRLMTWRDGDAMGGMVANYGNHTILILTSQMAVSHLIGVLEDLFFLAKLEESRKGGRAEYTIIVNVYKNP